MKLIIAHGFYGHMELLTDEKVKTGPFQGLDQRQMFEKIMREGYGNNVPAVFFAERTDGTVTRAVGKDAAGLIDDPGVAEVTVIAPIAGG